MTTVRLLKKSIPFLIAALYIMVHFSMFSLITYLAVSPEKSSSLYAIIYSLANINEATCCLQIQFSIFYLSLGLDGSFFLQSILTLIVQAIVSAV